MGSRTRIFSLLFILSFIDVVKAQNRVSFPAATSPSISPLTANIFDEQVYELKMSGATTIRVSKLQNILLSLLLITVKEYWFKNKRETQTTENRVWSLISLLPISLTLFEGCTANHYSWKFNSLSISVF